MLSMLAGHRRYARISALRFDGVLPELLGMTKVVSEDSVRRGLKKIDAEAGAAWVRRHLLSCGEPILNKPWILDVDTTIKPIYRHRESAEIGYNPKKAGRCRFTRRLTAFLGDIWGMLFRLERKIAVTS
jgi:hypothetical protein